MARGDGHERRSDFDERHRSAAVSPSRFRTSVYSNGDTPEAVATEGVAYTLDEMDSDVTFPPISLKKSENYPARNSRICAEREREGAGWPRKPMTLVAETNRWVSCIPPE